jgi:hypothetical protein
MKSFLRVWRLDVKLKRLLINGVLAATFGLSAVAVETGAFSSLASVAFAATTAPTPAPAPTYTVFQSNPAGSAATVSGTYVWTTDVSFTITVTGVNSGRITKVTVTTSNGLSQSYGSNGAAALTSFPLLSSGLTMAFGPSVKNKNNDYYTFTAKAPQNCDKKTKCNGT